MNWVWAMFLSCAAGSVFAVFWPYIVKLFKSSGPARFYVFDTDSPFRFLVWIVVGGVIGVVVAALGFATLLGTPENQAALKAQGMVAYFAAFTAGFSAGSLFEEPLKQ